MKNKQYKFSEETRRRMSKARMGKVPWNKGIPCSDEMKERLSRVMKGRYDGEKHPQFGMHCSDEKKRKLSKAFKGKPLSEEHKKSISQASKGKQYGVRKRGKEHHNFGKPMSDETKRKLYLSHKGIKKGPMSEETKEKIRQRHLGRVFTEETKEKMSKSAKIRFLNPVDHPRWRGGIACEPYCDAWADSDFRKDIMKRDNYECQNPDCWGTSTRLVLHHKDYNKQNCVPDNVVTVCRSCNARANSNRDYWQTVYCGSAKI